MVWLRHMHGLLRPQLTTKLGTKRHRLEGYSESRVPGSGSQGKQCTSTFAASWRRPGSKVLMGRPGTYGNRQGLGLVSPGPFTHWQVQRHVKIPPHHAPRVGTQPRCRCFQVSRRDTHRRRVTRIASAAVAVTVTVLSTVLTGNFLGRGRAPCASGAAARLDSETTAAVVDTPGS